MTAPHWTFTSSITHPDGTEVSATITAPESTNSVWGATLNERATPEPVLECAEVAQMGAVRTMRAYADVKRANEETVPF